MNVRVLLYLFSIAIFIAGIGILLVSTIRIPTWKRGVNFDIKISTKGGIVLGSTLVVIGILLALSTEPLPILASSFIRSRLYQATCLPSMTSLALSPKYEATDRTIPCNAKNIRDLGEQIQLRGEIFISVEYEGTEGWVARRMLKESP